MGVTTREKRQEGHIKEGQGLLSLSSANERKEEREREASEDPLHHHITWIMMGST
jgi:hypothetical protein